MMATFVYNAYSGIPRESQWRQYLQNSEYVTDIRSAIAAETESLCASLAGSASSMTEAIVGSLESGFDALAFGLSELGASIDALASTLDWRLAAVIDQQRISNLLLQNVAGLLRIPDVQKERQYHIEQGFKHYKNAVLDPDLFSDALRDLLQAEQREPTDYVVLHRIGMILLYAAKEVDLPKAEEYFRKAAKYAVVDSDPKSQTVANLLATLPEQAIHNGATKRLAADSLLQTAIACYVRGKMPDAVDLASRAFSLSKSLAEARFVEAKALAASGRDQDVVPVLMEAVQANRVYAVKALADADLAGQILVQQRLLELSKQTVQFATEKLEECCTQMHVRSQATKLLSQLQHRLNCHTYMDAMAVIDELSVVRPWRTSDDKERHIKLSELHGDVCEIRFSNDGTLLFALAEVSGEYGKYDTGVEVYYDFGRRHGHLFFDAQCLKIATNSDGTLLACGVGLFNLQDGEQEAEFYLDANDSIAFSADGLYIAFSEGQGLTVYDLETLTDLRKLTEDARTVESLSFSPDSTMVAASIGDSIYVWDVTTGHRLWQEAVPFATEFSWSLDGHRMAVRLCDGLTAIDASAWSRAERLDVVGTLSPDWTVSVCQEERELAGTKKPTVVLREIATGNTLAEYPLEWEPYTLSWSPCGRVIAVGSKSGGRGSIPGVYRSLTCGLFAIRVRAASGR
jgi:hypothetical protein